MNALPKLFLEGNRHSRLVGISWLRQRARSGPRLLARAHDVVVISGAQLQHHTPGILAVADSRSRPDRMNLAARAATERDESVDRVF